ncbi:hypothetical protein BJX70DRAFT_396230 [Aspergillus crustosus]
MPPVRRPRQHKFFLDKLAEWLSYRLRGPVVVALIGVITIADIVCCIHYTVRIVQFLYAWFTSQQTAMEMNGGTRMVANKTKTESMGLAECLRMMRPYLLGILTGFRLLWLIIGGLARQVQPWVDGQGFKYWTGVVEAAGIVSADEDERNPDGGPRAERTERTPEEQPQSQDEQNEDRQKENVHGNQAMTGGAQPGGGKGSQRKKNRKKKKKKKNKKGGR